MSKIVIILAIALVAVAVTTIMNTPLSRPKYVPRVNPTPTPFPSPSYGQIRISGEITCVPSSVNPAPAICFIGLKGDDGKYYGLKNLNQEDVISGKYTTGKRVAISGILTPPATEKFDIVGNIEISSIELL